MPHEQLVWELERVSKKVAVAIKEMEELTRWLQGISAEIDPPMDPDKE